MNTVTKNPQVLIANAFSLVLREWLSADEMRQINDKNVAAGMGADQCASHEFCDANMAMHEGWTMALKGEPNLEEQEELDMFYSAWQLAKEWHFLPVPDVDECVDVFINAGARANIDQIDAHMFTGDTFYTPHDARMLELYMLRWKRELALIKAELANATSIDESDEPQQHD